MKHIKEFEEFINEGFLQDIKDFVSGVKTDDDKLAKKLLSEVDKFTDIRNGFGRIEISYNFRYEGYQFELMDGYAKMYAPNKIEPIHIKSKFLSKLFSQVKSILNKRKADERRSKDEEEAKLKETEFADVVNTHGGIDGIAEIILDRIQNKSGFWKGQIRIDRPNELVMLSPIDESKEARSLINSLIVNLTTGQTTLNKSYGAYTDYKRYDGKLSTSELKSLDKYVKIAQETAKMKDDEKAEAIRNMIK